MSELELLAQELVYLAQGRTLFAGSVARLKSLTGEQFLENAITRIATAGEAG